MIDFKRGLLLSGGAFLAYSGVANAQVRSVDLPAEAAAIGIPDFARQAGIQVIVAASDLVGKKTNAVKAVADVHQSLQQLLAGTGIVITSDDGRTITLKNDTADLPASGANKGRQKSSSSDLTGPVLAENTGDPMPAAPDTAFKAKSGGLEEITVTAGRVASNLQQTPVSISAFDAASIESRQINDVVSLLANVPNLNGAPNVTLPGAVALFLRGVGSTESIVTVDPPVAIYVDDVVVARQQVDNFGLFDLQRVEVLRGPQGTLYGRNTAGGAIKLITNPPVDGYGFMTELGYGSYNQEQFRAMANTPIIDGRLLNRFTVALEHRDGFSKNITTGQDVNDLGDVAFHEALKFIATDDLQFDLKADYSKIRDHGVMGHDATGYYVPASSDYFINHSGSYPFNVAKTYGLNFYVDWTLPEGMDFKSISGARATSLNTSVDLSDQPIPVDLIGQHSFDRQYSQEFQLSGKFLDRIDFVSGLYYMYEYGHENLFTFAPGYNLSSGINYRALGMVPPVNPLVQAFESVHDRTDSYAAYAQFTDHLTDKLSFTAGLRYTVDQKAIGFFAASGPPGPPQNLTSAISNTSNVVADGVPNKHTFYQATPHLSLDYQFDPDLLGYASFTKGYQAGGWSARTVSAAAVLPFAPTYVKAYETGIKSEFWDKRVRFNADVFLQDESNLPTTFPMSNGFFGLTTIGVKIWGLEAEGTVKATPGLRINYSLGLLDYKYDPLSAGALAAKIGQHLRFAPYVTAKIGYDYIYPISDTYDLRFSNNYGFTGSHFTNPTNTDAAKSPSVILADAALSLFVDDGKYQITASCANCFDKKYFANSSDFGGVGNPKIPVVELFPGDPQTWLLSAKANF